MSRFIWVVSGAIGFITLVVISGIHLLAQDQAYLGQIQQTLASEDCPAACFLDVIVGDMLFSQAADVLKVHPWVEMVDVVDVQMQVTHVNAVLSENRPDFLPREVRFNVRGDAVASIVLDTEKPLGLFRYALGRATQHQEQGVVHLIGYENPMMTFQLESRCRGYWWRTTKITLFFGAPWNSPTPTNGQQFLCG